MRMVQVFWVQFEEVANESTFKTSKSKIKFQDFLEIKYFYQVNIASHSFLKKQQKKTWSTYAMCHQQTETKHPFLNSHVSISNLLWRLNSFCSLLIWLLFILFPDRVFTFFGFSVVFRLGPALASTTWFQFFFDPAGNFFHLFTSRTQALQISPERVSCNPKQLWKSFS